MRSSRLVRVAATAAALALTLLFVVLTPPASAAEPWPSVRQGATGADAVTVQYLLRQHGHDIPADGDFGPVTAAAVTDFQAAQGLTADGMVGPQTWPRLVVPVQQGSSGEAVKAAQTQLNKYGAGLTVDGAFGPVTDGAVRAYQGSHGLAVDGLVGPQTWQSLVSGAGGGDPSGFSLPLDRGALPREAYGASHWNANPAVDLIVSYVPAYAITSGVVDHYDSDSCGIGIRLLQPDGSRFIYCHLSERAVAEGAQVSAGTRLATTGDTGNSGEPHLHVEIRTSDGNARCPQSYLLAIYDGATPPSLGSLPTGGCTS
ncbi:peptidoglycan-binding protein [Actinophytocola sp.]|uniref:peptidoglycan-binding protein n=1 Tax=Actinophytocola sp. TaxID=1872138 RepID=UPI003D6B85F8